MTVQITRIITADEKSAMEDEAIAKGWFRNDRRMFTPGMAWYEEFYWMPPGWPKPKWMGTPGHIDKPHTQPGGYPLSVHYWRDWADKRPPIQVVCPNGVTWGVDHKSSNGDGWVVTGTLPLITCAPSILVPGYHGFLRDGQFTSNLDDPSHPDGVYPY